MSEATLISARLSEALNSPANGIAGLVDELLALAGRQRVSLAQQPDGYRVSLLNADSVDQIPLSVSKSVVRALLARFAALCNERHPNSVSPYGGESDLMFAGAPAKTIHVKFVNTPEEQSLELG